MCLTSQRRQIELNRSGVTAIAVTADLISPAERIGC